MLQYNGVISGISALSVKVILLCAKGRNYTKKIYNHGNNNVFLSFAVRNKYAKGLLFLQQDK